MKRYLLPVFLLVACAVSAAVKVPGIFSDHAVLARKSVTPVFGKADPGEKVVVEFNGQKKETVAGKDGKWRVDLNLADSPEGPFELKINDLVIKDVIVGEVWLCSGQSNMELRMATCKGYSDETAKPAGSRLRCFIVTRNSSKIPADNIRGKWVYASRSMIRSFSGVGFFFGKKLLAETGRPVGLIQSAWGGTDITAWISWDAISKVPAALKRSRKKEAGNLPRREKVKPSRLYNAMILPMAPYGVNGVIWYQGERNARNAHEYAALTRAWIAEWRTVFEDGNLPFYWCNLANFNDKNSDPNAKSPWAALRNQQTAALDVPHTGQAILIDVGEARDIHPRDKKTPGERLAAIALANVYGKKVPFAGPQATKAVRSGKRVQISFKNIESGLDARPVPAEYLISCKKNLKGKTVRNSPGAQLEGFAVCGSDGKYFWADKAEISGDTVIVSSAKVAEPVKVRYAWAQNPTCNLYNKAGFPAVPFMISVSK